MTHKSNKVSLAWLAVMLTATAAFSANASCIPVRGRRHGRHRYHRRHRGRHKGHYKHRRRRHHSVAPASRSSRLAMKRTRRHRGFVQYGKATWYGGRFHGRRTASGEPFDQNALTAAHRRLPFGTLVRVTRLDTKQGVTVRINDRGPYGKGRIVDLSKAAAKKLGMLGRGVVKVRLRVLRWGHGRYRRHRAKRAARRKTIRIQTASMGSGRRPAASSVERPRKTTKGRPVLVQNGFGRAVAVP